MSSSHLAPGHDTNKSNLKFSHLTLSSAIYVCNELYALLFSLIPHGISACKDDTMTLMDLWSNVSFLCLWSNSTSNPTIKLQIYYLYKTRNSYSWAHLAMLRANQTVLQLEIGLSGFYFYMPNEWYIMTSFVIHFALETHSLSCYLTYFIIRIFEHAWLLFFGGWMRMSSNVGVKWDEHMPVKFGMCIVHTLLGTQRILNICKFNMYVFLLFVHKYLPWRLLLLTLYSIF